jgi:hypothetical protein
MVAPPQATGQTAAVRHRPSRRTPAIPRPCHDYSPWCAKNPHHRLAPGYKGRRRPSSRELPNPAAVAIAAVVEFLALLIAMAARSPLAFPPVLLELARPRVVLAVPPARRITVPGGRPIAVADELHPPRDP